MNYERKSQEHKFPKTARGEKAKAGTKSKGSEDDQQKTKAGAETERIELIGWSKRAERRARKKQCRREADIILRAFLDDFLGPVPDKITRLDEQADDQDLDEVCQAMSGATSSMTPLESSVLPSTVDNIAELIEQRTLEDVKTEEHLPVPLKTPKVEVVVLYVGPFVLDSELHKKAEKWKRVLEEHFDVNVKMYIADPPFQTDDIDCKGYWLKPDAKEPKHR
eukprot:12400512-Karenia_brevis.AAC.1